MLWNTNKSFETLRKILGWSAGGVHKRIDENRELLELLWEEAPEFITKHQWVRNWIKNNDEFFTELLTAVPIEDGRFLSRVKTGQFPRPWPEEITESLIEAQKVWEAPKEWIEHAYPLQQITIKLQGTRHSERASIIGQLETVLDRLKAGDLYGYDHDDDYGYTFEVVAISNGPSFFDSAAGSK